MFNTKYNYKKVSIPEKNSGRSPVETAGYIPANQRIENMMLAGQRLSESRKEQYDFPDGEIDESYNDPTRSKNFDLADASQIQNNIEFEQKLKNDQKKQDLLVADVVDKDVKESFKKATEVE